MEKEIGIETEIGVGVEIEIEIGGGIEIGAHSVVGVSECDKSTVEGIHLWPLSLCSDVTV